MNKKFKELYDYCQAVPCPPYVSRNVVRDKVQALMDKQVRIIKEDLDTKVLRGLFLAGDGGSPFEIQNGNKPLVVIARGMSEDWDRLVQVKEMMHLFDEGAEMTSSADQLDLLLNSVIVQPTDDEPQVAAEVNALYMALACLCPEEARQKFMNDCKLGHTEEAEIAFKLKLPPHFVKVLLMPNFVDIVKKIWEE
jgi:hypothetical protein